eukprot:CAMPEP_0205833638 /NCGR_PEP_ID=MMETSP0206-20130828/50137_1 /ASSEMBLY_ACC=CAM_ASM_000279 /TAXON_ID=36767 /ORGANISM="Euplotes focardii, Strain TN1" /LENGTH=358 /DNA_ID=CAMNT_0053140199 /DNA_START=1886 /DNA_END=2962 /DNA_ORIENTATION=-
MAEVFSNMISFFCFLYGISILAFSDILTEGDTPVGWVAFILSLLFMFIPVKTIVDKCSKDAYKFDEMTYEKHSITFISDYNRANPMSEKECNIQFLEKMKEAGELDKDQYQQQVNMFNQGGRFGGVVNYGQQASTLQARVHNTYQPAGFGGGFARGFAAPQANFGGYMPRPAAGYGFNQGMPQRYVVRMAQPAMMQGGGQQFEMNANFGGRRVIMQRGAFMQPGRQQFTNNIARVIQQPNVIPNIGVHPATAPGVVQYQANAQAQYQQPARVQYQQPAQVPGRFQQAAQFQQQPAGYQQPVTYQQQPAQYQQQVQYAQQPAQQPAQQQYPQYQQPVQPTNNAIVDHRNDSGHSSSDSY